MGWETEEQITDAKDKAKRNVVSDRGKDKKKIRNRGKRWCTF